MTKRHAVTVAQEYRTSGWWPEAVVTRRGTVCPWFDVCDTSETAARREEPIVWPPRNTRDVDSQELIP